MVVMRILITVTLDALALISARAGVQVCIPICAAAVDDEGLLEKEADCNCGAGERPAPCVRR